MPGTSKPQAWGKGSHRELDPGPVAAKVYSLSSKRRPDRYLEFDPRPSQAGPIDSESFLRLVQSLHKPTGWGTLLCFHYEDYDLDANQEHILALQVNGLISNLKVIAGSIDYKISISCTENC